MEMGKQNPVESINSDGKGKLRKYILTEQYNPNNLIFTELSNLIYSKRGKKRRLFRDIPENQKEGIIDILNLFLKNLSIADIGKRTPLYLKKLRNLATEVLSNILTQITEVLSNILTQIKGHDLDRFDEILNILYDNTLHDIYTLLTFEKSDGEISSSVEYIKIMLSIIESVFFTKPQDIPSNPLISTEKIDDENIGLIENTLNDYIEWAKCEKMSIDYLISLISKYVSGCDYADEEILKIYCELIGDLLKIRSILFKQNFIESLMIDFNAYLHANNLTFYLFSYFVKGKLTEIKTIDKQELLVFLKEVKTFIHEFYMMYYLITEKETASVIIAKHKNRQKGIGIKTNISIDLLYSLRHFCDYFLTVLDIAITQNKDQSAHVEYMKVFKKEVYRIMELINIGVSQKSDILIFIPSNQLSREIFGIIFSIVDLHTYVDGYLLYSEYVRNAKI